MASKKIKKGTLIYLFIILGLLLTIVGVCVGIMIISPGVKILGYKYANFNINYSFADYESESKQLITTDAEPLNADSFNNLYIDSNYLDVKIVKLNENGPNIVKVEVISAFSGFYKANQVDTLKLTGKIENDETYGENTLKLKLLLPNGWSFSKDGSITVFVPNNRDLKSIYLNNTVGDVSILGEEGHPLNFQNAHIKSTKGNITFNEYTEISASATSIKLNSSSGNINVGSSVVNDDCNLEVGTTNGEINFSKDAKVKSITFSGDNGRYNFADVETIDEFKFNAVSGVFKAKTITGDFTCSEETTHTNFEIGTTASQFRLPKSGYSNVEIGTVKNLTEINTTKGKVKIDKVEMIDEKELKINTESGNIEIGENDANSTLTLTTSIGDINIKKCGGKINVISKSGKVTGYIESLKTGNSVETTSGDIDFSFKPGFTNIKFITKGKSVAINYGSGYTVPNTETTTSIGAGNYEYAFKSTKGDVIIRNGD